MPSDTDAIIVRIIATQKEYEKQMASVARSAERAAKASEAAFKRANDNIGTGAKRGGQQAQEGFKGASQAAGQLSFQLNDIATSLSGGASPFQVMMQQGSQVAQVMSQVRAAGGSMAQVLAGAFTSMLNPISLLSFGLIAVAGYALQYFTTAEDGGKEAEATFKKQRDLISEVAKAYGDALPALKAFNDYLDAQAGKVKQVTALEAAVQQAGDELRKSLQGAGTEGIDKVLGIFKNFEKLNLQPVIDQWEAYKKHVADGTVTIEEHQKMAEVLNRTLNSLPVGKAGELAAGFAMVIGPITRLIEQIQNLKKEMKTTGDVAADMINKMVPLTTIGPDIFSGAGKFFPSQTEMEDAGESAGRAYKEGLIRFLTSDKPITAADFEPGFAEKLKAFLEAAPGEGIKIFSGRRTLQHQRELYDEAIRKYGRADLPGHQVAFPTPEAPHVSGRAADLRFDSDAVKKWAHDNAEAFGLVFNVEGEYWHVSEVQAQKRAARRKQERTDFTDWLVESQKRIDQTKYETAVNADNTATLDEKSAAIERHKFIQQGLDAAKAQGIPITADLTAKIEAQATAMANAGLAADQLATKQKQVSKSAQEQAAAQQQLAQQIGQMVGGAITGFISDLRNGVSAGDAFNNMLNRILDSLIDMAVQMLIVKPLMSALGGGVGVGVGSMAGGGTVGLSRHMDGRKFSPALWAGAPRFATGGVVGLRPGEIPIVAHKGEVVVPKARVGRHGGGAYIDNSSSSTTLGPVSIDMSQSGYVASDNESAKQFGMNIQKMIRVEMVRESRPGGLLRRT
jgi:Prophage tail length tape measure protein/Lambda phage tail tape-measure protein (Tape_meas_lam_C)